MIDTQHHVVLHIFRYPRFYVSTFIFASCNAEVTRNLCTNIFLTKSHNIGHLMLIKYLSMDTKQMAMFNHLITHVRHDTGALPPYDATLNILGKKWRLCDVTTRHNYDVDFSV